MLPTLSIGARKAPSYQNAYDDDDNDDDVMMMLVTTLWW